MKGMKGRYITEDEYDEAVKKVIREMVYDPDLEEMLEKLIVPLNGVRFAARVKRVLFDL